MKSFTHTFFSVLALACMTNADFPGIDREDMIEEMEHFLVDNTGTNSVPIVAAVSPCSNYAGFASDPTNRGEQTSAQWVRFAFHDFVTGNVAAGTGGLDASLGFESDRPENHGLFVNDTLEFLAPTQSAYLSMADQIALGVLVSVAQCGGNAKAIPLRVGRIDASAAGPSGVPTPFTAIEPTLAQFAQAGMSQSDTIGLVYDLSFFLSPNADFASACGHSLGRVHAVNFPDIVGDSPITSTNLDGGVSFDSTPAALDPTGMNEYLTGTGKAGGPLVTSSNVSARSDFRLFNSDSNATITTLAANTGQICSGLFEKMLNTVPSTVSLSDPITAMPWKVVDFNMHISSGGSVRIEGLIRALWTDTAPPNQISYTLVSSSGNGSTHLSDAASGTGSGLFGSTTYYHFVIATDSPGTTGMTFEGFTYNFSDEIFILPSQSTVKSGANTIEIKAAVLTSTLNGGTMTGTLYVPETQEGTLAKKINIVTVPMTVLSTNGDYTLFDGLASVSGVSSVIAKVAVGDTGSKTVKTTLFAQD
ncbi:related to beta-1,3 exoglucanase precursor [Phialocephala subalpina]|uniref:Peroxidase n=1 Tax=Phialocephala subalpina TaxID=576137 RepID=A0A1L7WW35_9HELO|nr:related to beta-1,3 exoglucanase precursor [Phialocephala subalpina]